MSISSEEVIAHDLATDEVRTFKLAKIELLDAGERIAAYDPNGPPPGEDPGPLTLGESLGWVRAEFEALGWHVQIHVDGVSLHNFFKNGKPRKTPVVGISFSEWTVDMFDDGDGRGLQEVRRPSKRPYYVFSSGFTQARTFAGRPNAVALFLEEARRLAPNSAT